MRDSQPFAELAAQHALLTVEVGAWHVSLKVEVDTGVLLLHSTTAGSEGVSLIKGPVGQTRIANLRVLGGSMPDAASHVEVNLPERPSLTALAQNGVWMAVLPLGPAASIVFKDDVGGLVACEQLLAWREPNLNRRWGLAFLARAFFARPARGTTRYGP